MSEFETMRELLKYPNPEGLHPNEAHWRDFARKLEAENAALRGALQEIVALENNDRDDGYAVCASIMRYIAEKALQGETKGGADDAPEREGRKIRRFECLHIMGEGLPYCGFTMNRHCLVAPCPCGQQANACPDKTPW